jgi:quinol monooxygenase YgiN
MSMPARERRDTPPPNPSLRRCSPIVELRQYTLRPGRRDTLIALFDREFVESQEALGMRIIGQFRDLDDPTRFVWLRGFDDMQARREALQSFYGGPVWKAHSAAANATMIDSDNVLLLRPARPASAFALDLSDRPSHDTQVIPSGLVVATIVSLDAPPDAAFLHFFEDAVAPALTERGASIRATLVTEASANTFPALPVRENEQVFVWFAGFRDQATYDKHVALMQSKEDSATCWKPMAHRLLAEPQVLRLAPTARSLLRG